MELVLDSITETVLSDYEIERNKPMPNLTHGAIQLNLGFELKSKYGNRFRIASEVALATIPDGTTPDLVVYPKKALNFVNEIAKQTEAPLLTIEIQSPSQSNDLMIDKAYQYFEFGVKSSWIVFPALKGVAVYTSPNEYDFFHDDEILKDRNLDLEIDLKRVFE
jgi:Uma2 family endonuclease